MDNLYTFDITDTPKPLSRTEAEERLPKPLQIQEKLEKEFKPKVKPAIEPRKQPDLPPVISGTPWTDDPNIHLLRRYFGLPQDLDNPTAKKLEAIINYAIIDKKIKDQRGLLKTIAAIERQAPQIDRDNRLSLVYRYILLEGEE